MLTMREFIHLRQQALSQAMETANPGEPFASIMQRAEAFLAFLVQPARSDVIEAMAERRTATLH